MSISIERELFVRTSLLAAPLLLGGALSPVQAADGTLCKLFTQKEASAYVGAQVGDGESGLLPGVPGCAWSDEATNNKMSISVAPAGNALQLKNWGFESWQGFRSVSGIGAKAYVVSTPTMEIMGKKMGGEWQAGAIVGNDYVAIGLKGPKANADAAISLLKDAIKRRQ
jgi:hypothetical protein